jgi:ribosomal-protein-alanine N-acetyltransferase
MVHRYLGEKPISTLAEARAIIRHVQGQYRNNGIGRWTVLRKSDGVFLGWAGLKFEWSERFQFHYYDLGYRLIRKFWGQGYATEASVALVNHGFEKMQLEEIFAAAHLENDRSNAILTKIGFTFLERFEYDNAIHNWYGLRRKEFYM